MGTHHQREREFGTPLASLVVIDRDRFGHGGINGRLLVRGFSRDLVHFKNPKRHPRSNKRSVQTWIAHERLTRAESR